MFDAGYVKSEVHVSSGANGHLAVSEWTVGRSRFNWCKPFLLLSRSWDADTGSAPL